jgi:alpha-aminoadipate carrier protein LysW
VTARSSCPSRPRLSEIVQCPECSSELEVVSLAPPALALAPEIEEDWGE